MLTERKLQIVLAVVHEFIQTGEPAGSRTLSKKYLKGHSAATIRNEMADLEEMGYFYQPHSSAGRLPTPKAYRVHVDSILQRPSVVPAVDLRINEIRQSRYGLESRLAQISGMLGQMTNYLGMAAVRLIDQVIFQRVQLIRTSSSTAIMIIVLDGGIVHQSHLRMDESLSQERLDELSGDINRLGAGKPWMAVKNTVYAYLRDQLERQWDMCKNAVDALDELMTKDQFSFSAGGFSRLFSQVAQEDFGRLQAIFSLLEQDAGLEELLKSYAVNDGLSVAIGTENPNSLMKDYSVVVASSSNRNRQTVVGLIGPMRMNYERAIGLLQTVLGELGEDDGNKDDNNAQ